MSIKRSFFYSIAGILMLLGCDSYPQDKPNIILIVVDDLGYADLGFLPNAAPDVSTPNVDQLAANATFFSRAYATAPICSPSRAGLITGKYQQRWGNYWYGEGGLPKNEVKLPQLLKENGYFTAKIGKNHLNGGPVKHPLDHGYDYFLGFLNHTWDYLRLSEEDVAAYGAKNAKQAYVGPLIRNREKVSYKDAFTTDIFSEEAVRIIEKDSNQPFFIHLSYNAVHHPTYVGHPAYLEKYGLEQFPFWNPAKETYAQWHKQWGHLGEVDPNGRKRYLLQLNVLDDGIGEIIASLESSGKMDNTIIVLVSDNGGTINTYANNQPLSGYKYMFGEGGIRVPMLWHVPVLKSGKKQKEQLVSAMDIMPTLLDFAGIATPDSLDGKSLSGILQGKDEKVHDQLFWSNGRDQWVAIDDNWKLAHNTGWIHQNYKTVDGKHVRDEPYQYGGGIQLFDLETDIGEQNDLASANAGHVERLTKAYWKWRTTMSDPKTSEGKVKKIAGGYPISGFLADGVENIYSNGSQINNYAAKAIDGNPETYWQSKKGNDSAILPYFLVTQFNDKISIRGLELLPKQEDKRISRIKNYACYASDDNKHWQLVSKGTWENDDVRKSIVFPKAVEGRYFKLQVNSLYGKQNTTAIAELKWLKRGL